MSGFIGKNTTEQQIPSDVAGLRGDFAAFLSGRQQGGSKGSEVGKTFGMTKPPSAGPFAGLQVGDPNMDPYRQLFDQQNARTFAQARESVGNLTGTGLTNTLGNAAANASTQQGAFLADMLSRTRTDNANRYASVLTPFLNQGVGPPQTSYTPGFLDYLGSAAKSASEAYAASRGG